MLPLLAPVLALISSPALAQQQAQQSEAVEPDNAQTLEEVRAGFPVCYFSQLSEEGEPLEERHLAQEVRDGYAQTPVSLLAICGTIGTSLGVVDRYRSADNIELGLTILEYDRFGNRRVIVFQREDDGSVSREDLSGVLAVRAGRLPTRGIERLEVDLADFAEDASIGLSGDKFENTTEGRRAVSLNERFGVREHMQDVRNRRSGVQSAGEQMGRPSEDGGQG